jgi:hypothetical protein
VHADSQIFRASRRLLVVLSLIFSLGVAGVITAFTFHSPSRAAVVQVAPAAHASNPRIIDTRLVSQHEVSESQTYVSGNDDWKYVDNGHMVLDNQSFIPGVSETLFNHGDGPNFTIGHSITPTFDWNAWPTLFYGCWYTVCARHGVLPEPVYKLHSIPVTEQTNFPSTASGNDALDMWFNKEPTTTAPLHPDGAEIMLWNRWSHNEGVPSAFVPWNPKTPGNFGIIYASGHPFWFATWGGIDNGRTWNYLQFRLPEQSSDLSNFNADILVKWCIHEGFIKESWTATAFDAGFEVVQGDLHAAITNYNIKGF